MQYFPNRNLCYNSSARIRRCADPLNSKRSLEEGTLHQVATGRQIATPATLRQNVNKSVV